MDKLISSYNEQLTKNKKIDHFVIDLLIFLATNKFIFFDAQPMIVVTYEF
ncbi:MAG: hypothetical protein M1114_03895 [Candidatus Dependentiae bacterium]|nr:hypothetical protein [Candidatus Dependentiae bacterium]